MANVSNSNTFYIDSTGSLLIKNLKAMYVTVTATAANAILNLQDADTSVNKINLRVAISGDTQEFRFEDSPIVFPNGIKANTVTNCVATVVIKESRG